MLKMTQECLKYVQNTSHYKKSRDINGKRAFYKVQLEREYAKRHILISGDFSKTLVAYHLTHMP